MGEKISAKLKKKNVARKEFSVYYCDKKRKELERIFFFGKTSLLSLLNYIVNVMSVSIFSCKFLSCSL